MSNNNVCPRCHENCATQSLCLVLIGMLYFAEGNCNFPKWVIPDFGSITVKFINDIMQQISKKLVIIVRMNIPIPKRYVKMIVLSRSVHLLNFVHRKRKQRHDKKKSIHLHKSNRSRSYNSNDIISYSP